MWKVFVSTEAHTVKSRMANRESFIHKKTNMKSIPTSWCKVPSDTPCSGPINPEIQLTISSAGNDNESVTDIANLLYKK